MKGFIEKFKSAGTAKRVMFVTAVVYIMSTLLGKYKNAGELPDTFGASYFVTVLAVNLAKIAVLFLVGKLLFAVRDRLKDEHGKTEDYTDQ